MANCSEWRSYNELWETRTSCRARSWSDLCRSTQWTRAGNNMRSVKPYLTHVAPQVAERELRVEQWKCECDDGGGYHSAHVMPVAPLSYHTETLKTSAKRDWMNYTYAGKSEESSLAMSTSHMLLLLRMYRPCACGRSSDNTTARATSRTSTTARGEHQSGQGIITSKRERHTASAPVGNHGQIASHEVVDDLCGATQLARKKRTDHYKRKVSAAFLTVSVS